MRVSGEKNIGDRQRRLLLRAGLTAGFALPASRLWAHAREAALPVRRRIHLDPGHGGHDPGAIGVRGTYEKHITIAAAHALAARLAPAYDVTLSRTGDVFVPLEARVAAAEAAKADLFVSLHADAFADDTVRGASLYTLSAEASDPLAQAVADSENQAGSAGVDDILADLTRTETRGHSVRLARALAHGLDNCDVSLMPEPARHANFAVLRSASIPSVLVEMGFLSNAADEELLLHPQHRGRVAEALAAGIDHFVHGIARRTG